MFIEKRAELVKAYKNDKEVLDLINDTFNDFAEYIKCVIELENSICILKSRLEPRDYRERIMYLDTNLKIIHNGIVMGVKMLNRYCKALNMEAFFDGDVTNRLQISDLAMAVTKEIFDNRE